MFTGESMLFSCRSFALAVRKRDLVFFFLLQLGLTWTCMEGTMFSCLPEWHEWSVPLLCDASIGNSCCCTIHWSQNFCVKPTSVKRKSMRVRVGADMHLVSSFAPSEKEFGAGAWSISLAIKGSKSDHRLYPNFFTSQNVLSLLSVEQWVFLPIFSSNWTM